MSKTASRTQRRILKWLAEGARIWSPARGKKAFVCLPDNHPDGDYIKVLTRTMQTMEDADLVVNRFGVWNEGGEYSDNIWTLPGDERGKPDYR